MYNKFLCSYFKAFWQFVSILKEFYATCKTHSHICRTFALIWPKKFIFLGKSLEKSENVINVILQQFSLLLFFAVLCQLSARRQMSMNSEGSKRKPHQFPPSSKIPGNWLQSFFRIQSKKFSSDSFCIFFTCSIWRFYACTFFSSKICLL